LPYLDVEYRPFAHTKFGAAAAEKAVPYWYTTDMHRCAPHLLPFELEGTETAAMQVAHAAT